MVNHGDDIAPIKLRATLHETIWGGTNLARVAGKPIAPGSRIGESWETEASNVALNAPYTGATLAALVNSLGAALIGTRAQAVYGPRFPLLAKFIDAHEDLSVQVHPSDGYAREHEHGSLGKTEAWYVLAVEPGARLVYGWRRSTSADEVRAAVARGQLEQLLDAFEAQPGDVIFVPAGTVHAIGAGITLYELQEYSSITYRLYDYGRRQADGSERALHVDRALDVLNYGASGAQTVNAVAVPGTSDAARRVLVGCDYFVLEEIIVSGTLVASTSPASCEIISVVGGSCRVRASDGREYALALGETIVLPAALSTYDVLGEQAQLLRSYVPEPDDHLLALWRAGQ